MWGVYQLREHSFSEGTVDHRKKFCIYLYRGVVIVQERSINLTINMLPSLMESANILRLRLKD
jgi:hypothetical protein